MVIVGVVVIVALFALAWIGSLVAARSRQRNEAADRKAELIMMKRNLDSEIKMVAGLERVERLKTIKSLVTGEKCRGCARIVDHEDMEDVGENQATGKPVRLCRECRGLTK